mmetsp:Transcript_3872/g.8444  ORF Transcript_3872/g.8444 Transcript_3872/m.8444 type:complete len:88 (-) Transcript_3872:133-396(-)
MIFWTSYDHQYSSFFLHVYVEMYAMMPHKKQQDPSFNPLIPGQHIPNLVPNRIFRVNASRFCGERCMYIDTHEMLFMIDTHRIDWNG